MDGNKKIRGIVFAGIITLAMTACKVQPPGYVSLYLDNFTMINDTLEPGEMQLSLQDTILPYAVDTADENKPELPVSDSAYQHEVNELLKAITDSIQLMRRQIIELQNQHVFKPDTNFLGNRIHKVQPLDSLQPYELKQLIQVKNDTIAMLRNQVTKLKKSDGLKADTVYISNETVKQSEGDSLQTDYKTTPLLQAKNDTIDLLPKQVHELQSNDSIKTDTIYVFKETTKLPVAESRQTDTMTLQLIKAKDEQIQMLQNQLNTMQTAAIRNPQQTHIIREPVQTQPLGQQTDHSTRQLLMAKDEQIQMLQNQLNAIQTTAATTPQQTRITNEPGQDQPLGSQQTDSMTLQLLQARNDTILFLQSQLNNLQLQLPKKDTVIVENGAKEMQPPKELVTEQKTSDLFQALQDTTRLLKTQVPLEEQIPPGKDTTALSGQYKNDIPSPAITDTTLLVAFYELGEIKPLEEESILKQIKELCSNKNVTKIALSGFTDSSGNELINKEITNNRLNYLSEMIIPWIEKEKIFFQNFGDTLASEMVVRDERRIEIRIHTK